MCVSVCGEYVCIRREERGDESQVFSVVKLFSLVSCVPRVLSACLHAVVGFVAALSPPY